MARPTILSGEDFLNSGLSIIDSEGLDALTFRHLGETMGVSHTAAHSHDEAVGRHNDQAFDFGLDHLLGGLGL